MEASLAEVMVGELEAGRSLWLATAVASDHREVPLGARLLILEDLTTRGSLGVPALDLEALGRIRANRPRNHLRFRWPEAGDAGSVEVLVEWIQAAPWLLVLGAGGDADALVAIGAAAGLRVAVVDHRPSMARPERFPLAEVVLTAEPEEIPDRLLTPQSHAVILTHQFQRDLRWLKRLLPSPAAYVGILGPRDRAERLLAQVRGEGYDPTKDELDRLY